MKNKRKITSKTISFLHLNKIKKNKKGVVPEATPKWSGETTKMCKEETLE